MARLAGDERTYALRFCGRVTLKDGDPCPMCEKPLGKFQYEPAGQGDGPRLRLAPERKTVEHKFYVPSEFGEDWVSISTAAHILDKGGALSGWAYNIAISGVLKLGADIRGWSEEQLKAAMKQAGYTPWIKKDRAASRGDEVHTAMELLGKGATLEDVSDFIARIDIPKFTPEEIREVQGYALGAAHWYLDQKNLEPLLVERLVWSAKHRFSGTLDLYALRDKAPIVGKVARLTDLKSSKDVFEDHPVQLDGYGLALAEMIDQGLLDLPKPEEHSIVLARPDGTYEEHVVPSNPQSFIDALNLTRAVMEIKDYLKTEIWDPRKKAQKEEAND